MARKLKPTGKTPRNLYRTSKSQERAGAGPGHLSSIVIGSGPARREGLVNLPNAVPLTPVGQESPWAEFRDLQVEARQACREVARTRGVSPPNFRRLQNPLSSPHP